MKKAVIFVAILCLFIFPFTGEIHAAGLENTQKPSLSMQIMGESINNDDLPIIRNGQLYLPLRTVGESMGYKVDYNAKGKTIDLVNNIRKIKMSINGRDANVDGKGIMLPGPLYIENGKTYALDSTIYPVFGVSVKYDKGSGLVKIGCLNPISQNHNYHGEKGIYVLNKKADNEFLPLINDDKIMIPLRPIGEGLGYVVNWDIQTQVMSFKKENHSMAFVINSQKAIVNGEEITMDEKTLMVGGRAYVPLAFLEKNLDYSFEYNNVINNLIIEKKDKQKPISKVQDISYMEESGFPQLEIIADSPIEYKTFTLDNPSRMVIDVMDAIADTEFEFKEIHKGDLIRVRIGQFSAEPNIARIVVDLKDHKKVKVVQSQDKESISLVYANVIQPITISREGSKDVITVKGSENIESSLFKLENPNRVVVDIEKAVLEGKEQNLSVTSSNIIKSVRTGQFEVGTARIVLDIEETAFYDIKTEGSTAKIYLSATPFDFMEYDKSYNLAYVNLNPKEKTEYNSNFNKEENILTIDIKKDIEYQKDMINIDDNLVEYIKIKKKMSNNKVHTVAEFKLKENVGYELATPELSSLIKIKLMHLPKEPEDVLIIVDAGHGGKDPGAKAVDGSSEKDYNLDVAKKLNRKLQGLGFKTIMTRSDDSYVTLQERVSIANSNYGDFFMSVHFNAFVAKTQGIETLYYPNSPKESYGVYNKDIASIFQKELIDNLKRPNRGVVPRPNLYVLNKTKMPAILAELGFITNKEELSLIKKEEYREKAANALVVSIVRYYKEIRGIDFGIDISEIY